MENKKVIPAVGILALVIIMIIMVSLIFLPYASVILWAIFIYILTSPIYNKLISFINPKKAGYALKKSIIAATLSILMVAVIVAVLSFVLFKVFGQGKKLLLDIARFTTTFLETYKENNDLDIIEIVKNISMGTVDLSRFDLQKELLNIVTIYSNKIINK